jgi:hypothetical protein
MKKLFSIFAVAALAALSISAQAPTQWKPHDRNRPVPPVIDSGFSSTQDAPGKAPSDAIVLFDGKDLPPGPRKTADLLLGK